jgi:hypothetical protein
MKHRDGTRRGEDIVLEDMKSWYWMELVPEEVESWYRNRWSFGTIINWVPE